MRCNMLNRPALRPGTTEYRALTTLQRLGGDAWVSEWIGALWWHRCNGPFVDTVVWPLERAGLIVVDVRRCVLTEAGYAALGHPVAEFLY